MKRVKARVEGAEEMGQSKYPEEMGQSKYPEEMGQSTLQTGKLILGLMWPSTIPNGVPNRCCAFVSAPAWCIGPRFLTFNLPLSAMQWS